MGLRSVKAKVRNTRGNSNDAAALKEALVENFDLVKAAYDKLDGSKKEEFLNILGDLKEPFENNEKFEL